LLFHPERGWVRRLERWASLQLSARIYPRIPGLRIPYEWQLRRSLVLSEAEIGLRGLAEPFDGVRLLLITDLHAGPFLSEAALGRTLERLLALEPDLILLGGDLTTARIDELWDCAPVLSRLKAPLGVFAVLGNHDYYSGQPRLVREVVERCGVTVLHNRSARVERGGRWLSIAGVDDLLLGRPDLDAALDGTQPPVVLLSHNPDLFFAAERRGVALMLSGHTHAGQIRVPGLPVLVRQSRYRLDEGRFRIGETELVVSRGIGTVGLPWRVACAPEAVLLTLRRRGSAAED
jgi:predicted MPP superfamily phosphohydrolase